MYWGIPPEINAFRLTRMGAGPGAHAAQIAAYTTAATTYVGQGTQQAVTAVATSAVFQGPGGAGMLASAMPSAAWMTAAGAHASAAAATIATGVDAFAAATTATIAHEVVVANRVREAVLQATNILGQNTPAIGEANAEYAVFWAQNAGAMMGYLAAVTAVVSALSVPLPPLTQVSDPVAVLPAAAGAMGAQALGAGIGAVNAGLTTGAGMLGAGSGAVSAGIAAPAGFGHGVPAPLAPLPPHSAEDGGSSPAPATATPNPMPGALQSAVVSVEEPGASASLAQPALGASVPPAPGGQGDIMQLAQPLMGVMTSAPSMLSGALSSPASSLGQISSLMGPLSSLAGGMSGGLGSDSGLPGLSAAGSPWSGLSGVNGGFAGGGSPVVASLTKPSAGARLGGPVDLPEGWWAQQPTGAGSQSAAAGLRGTGAAGGGAMAPGMFSTPLGAASGSRGGAQYGDIAEAGKSIAVTATAHSIPILTNADGVVYTGGQGG